MRSITIDFTKSPISISNMVLGRKGEKNATQLIITPPTEMAADDSGIVKYCVAYQIGANRKTHSELHEKSETITVKLDKSVTRVNVLSLQLEGYDGEDTIIMKSELVKDLIFDASVEGEEYEGGSSSNLGAQVAANTAKLKNFSVGPNGETLYNGKPLGSDRPTAQAEMGSDAFILDMPYPQRSFVIADDLEQTAITLGTEIKTVEFKLVDRDELVDIHRMFELDGIPCILMMNRMYDDTTNDIPRTIAQVYLPVERNAVYVAASLNNVEKVVITYYTDGGVASE